MALSLMYITNRPEVARLAEAAGVDRIFVDLEWIGKAERQCGMDTVQSRHTAEDVKAIAEAITAAQLIVRINPIHDATDEYGCSEQEINAVIENGADIIMLPYFKSAAEVKRFVCAVGGRAQTMILIETPEAVDAIDDILDIEGIDLVHIGLNDLSLGYGKKFMFELLEDGTVERMCDKLRRKNLTYGFGGIASLGNGRVPAELVIREHYRLGSTCAILSRSFCNVNRIADINDIRDTFINGMRDIRALEAECEIQSADYFEVNKRKLDAAIRGVID